MLNLCTGVLLITFCHPLDLAWKYNIDTGESHSALFTYCINTQKPP
ncbi:hypothetical protein [Klebsiella phage vB_KpnS-MUC-5]|nr:hypothetical protein [Klebsiella phage vB_KpnS-MUC-5]